MCCDLLFAVAVIKYHTIKGHRCEVKKALSKEDLQSSGGGGGGMRGGNYQHNRCSFISDVIELNRM